MKEKGFLLACREFCRCGHTNEPWRWSTARQMTNSIAALVYDILQGRCRKTRLGVWTDGSNDDVIYLLSLTVKKKKKKKGGGGGGAGAKKGYIRHSEKRDWQNFSRVGSIILCYQYKLNTFSETGLFLKSAAFTAVAESIPPSPQARNFFDFFLWGGGGGGGACVGLWRQLGLLHPNIDG